MAKNQKLTGINYIPLNPERTEYIDFNDLPEEKKREVSDKITTRFMASLGYRKVNQEDKAQAT